MKKTLRGKIMKKTLLMSLVLAGSLIAADYSSVIQHPDASKLIQKDLLPPAKHFKMPANCVTTNSESIARGAFLFHNLNGKKAKKNPPKGLSRKQMKPGKTYLPGDKIPSKQYGNCIACHDIEGSVGPGNVGPSLVGYKKMFVDSGVRDAQFVYQQIADARALNPESLMTINLANGLFSSSEVCDLTSYILAPK